MRISKYWILALTMTILPLLAAFSSGTVAAQEGPISAINNPNPGAELWEAVRGRLDTPATTQVKGHDSAVLVNQEGDQWTAVRNKELLPKGGDLLIVVLLIIGAVYAMRGPVTLHAGASGKEMDRHSVNARFVHWFLAGIFIALALSGLILLFGRPLLIPLFGKEAFGTLAYGAKNVHNFVGPLFPVAIFLLFFNMVSKNLYERGDLKWFAQGGGMFGKSHASAGKFNPGEKILFWLTIFLGIVVSVTGYVLDFPAIASWMVATFPEFTQYRHVMELSHVIHTIIAVLFIALVFGHIFLAVFFVPGTLQGMVTGKVDENWAKEHHDRWYAEMKGAAKSDA